MLYYCFRNVNLVLLIHAVMSSHDSISMVFKCMMKGAADFLVKPIRKNELRNLWQHVWRRQIVSLTLILRTFSKYLSKSLSYV